MTNCADSNQPLRQEINLYKEQVARLTAELKALQSAHEKYEHLFNLSLDGICWAGFDGYFKKISPSFERITGHTIESLTSKQFIEFVHPDDRERTLNEFADLLGGKKVLHFDNRYVRKDGSYVWLSWTAVADKDTQVAYAIARDITKQKQLDTTLREADKQLAKLSRLSIVNTLLTGLAHEINQPLTSIALYVESCSKLLEKENISTETRELFEKIISQVERTGRIIHHTREIAKHGYPSKSSANINTIIENSIKLLESEITHHGINVECKLPSQLSHFYFDTVQIEQVIINIMHNAIEALHENKIPKPTIGIAVALKKERALEIIIRNNGPEIDENDLDKIFDPFFSTKSLGSGMGLAISESILESHRGNVKLTSNVDEEICFTVTLPIDLKGNNDD